MRTVSIFNGVFIVLPEGTPGRVSNLCSEGGVIHMTDSLLVLATIYRDIGRRFASNGQHARALQAYGLADRLLDRVYERI